MADVDETPPPAAFFDETGHKTHGAAAVTSLLFGAEHMHHPASPEEHGSAHAPKGGHAAHPTHGFLAAHSSHGPLHAARGYAPAFTTSRAAASCAAVCCALPCP